MPTSVEVRILHILANHGSLYPSELTSLYRDIPQGTVYRYLKRMEGWGWVRSELMKRPNHPGPALRYYQVTAWGLGVMMSHERKVDFQITGLSFEEIQFLIMLRESVPLEKPNPVLGGQSDKFNMATDLSERGYLAMEQVAQGCRLHITRAGMAIVRKYLETPRYES